MKKPVNKSEATVLRQKAEELLKNKPLKHVLSFSEAEYLKLIFELEVHQIELELQNHELTLAKELADEVARKYAELYDFAPSGYFTLSRGGEIIGLNLAAAQMLGKGRSNLINSSFKSFISDSTKPVFKIFLNKVFINKVKESCEISLNYSDKQPVYIHLSGIANEQGNHCNIIAVDITQRHIAGEKIRFLNARLENILNEQTFQLKESDENRFKEIEERIKVGESLKEALERQYKIEDRIPGFVFQYCLNPDGSSCFPYASDGIQDVFRVCPEEVAVDASIIFTRIHPDDIDDVMDSIMTSAKDQNIWQQEFRLRFDDGTLRWLSGNAKPQAEADGTIMWHGYISDITDRKQAEAEFKESTEKHRGLSEAAFDSIFFSEKGLCIEQNQMAEKMFGYTNEEAIGRYGTDWIDEADRKMVMDNMLAGYEEPYEVTALKKDGSTFPCMLSGRMMHYKGKTVRVTSLSDITLRKQAEEALIEARNEAVKANQAKSEFLSRMSHELRTPMNSILGFAQLLKMGDLKASHQKGVNHILNSGRHLLNLINEVLDVAGIEAGRQILTPELVKLSDIIQEVTDIVQVSAYIGTITIDLVDSPANNVSAFVDKLRLKQILLNLLSNAIKYNREGGLVSIKTEMRSSGIQGNTQVRISIIDTGLGIKPEDISKLFQAFERIGADKTEIEGSGLGLMIVKRLIEAMGGSVGVNSEFGKGSTFWVELPWTENTKSYKQQNEENLKQISEIGGANPEIELQNEEKAKRADELVGANRELVFFNKNDSLKGSHDHRKTGIILYLEDNLANTELVEQILLSYRSSINLVCSIYGKQAVSLAIEFQPDLILLDLDLSDIQGLEVMQLLQMGEKTKDIPVVIVSADAMPLQIEKLINAGAKDYLTKPIELLTFLQVVDKWVGVAD